MCGHGDDMFHIKNYGIHSQYENKNEKFLKVFGKKKVFLPVIHVIDIDQTMKCLDICFNIANVDGVFLINNYCSTEKLIEVYKEAKIKFSEKWIGLNILGNVFQSLILYRELQPSGIWIDDSGVFDDNVNIATFIQSIIAKWNIKSLYFGGICFKYRDQPSNMKLTASNASKFMDVVVTSGNKTGEKIEMQKLQTIKKGIVNTPIGVASGIDENNIDEIGNDVDVFIVNTSISEKEIFNVKKLFKLKNKISKF